LPVSVVPPLPVPTASYEAGRNQYNSTKILRELIREPPAGASKLLGIIEKDLCIPILTFVFGEAQLGGTVAIVSTARLRQEFYGMDADRYLACERLRKESLHELGHTFGLIHCPSRDCVMHLSNTIGDVDRKGRIYCESCLSVLQSKSGAGRT
jgi:archaemetzincin